MESFRRVTSTIREYRECRLEAFLIADIARRKAELYVLRCQCLVSQYHTWWRRGVRTDFDRWLLKKSTVAFRDNLLRKWRLEEERGAKEYRPRGYDSKHFNWKLVVMDTMLDSLPNVMVDHKHSRPLTEEEIFDRLGELFGSASPAKPCYVRPDEYAKLVFGTDRCDIRRLPGGKSVVIMIVGADGLPKLNRTPSLLVRTRQTLEFVPIQPPQFAPPLQPPKQLTAPLTKKLPPSTHNSRRPKQQQHYNQSALNRNKGRRNQQKR